MLRELPPRSAPAGTPKRRWFYCNELDLVVFEQPDGRISGFQLAYRHLGDEHSLSWDEGRGLAHYSVDNGPLLAGSIQTPLLQEDGPPLPRGRILERFRQLSPELPAAISGLVEQKIREFAGPTGP